MILNYYRVKVEFLPGVCACSGYFWEFIPGLIELLPGVYRNGAWQTWTWVAGN